MTLYVARELNMQGEKNERKWEAVEMKKDVDLKAPARLVKNFMCAISQGFSMDSEYNIHVFTVFSFEAEALILSPPFSFPLGCTRSSGTHRAIVTYCMTCLC